MKYRFHNEQVGLCLPMNTSCISTKSVTKLAEWLIALEYKEGSSVGMPSGLWNRFIPWRDNLKQIKSFSFYHFAEYSTEIGIRSFEEQKNVEVYF